MWRTLVFSVFVLLCIIETQNAMLTDGRSFQEVGKYFDCFMKFNSIQIFRFLMNKSVKR